MPTWRVSVSESLGWGLGTSISNKVPGDAAAPGDPTLRTTAIGAKAPGKSPVCPWELPDHELSSCDGRINREDECKWADGRGPLLLFHADLCQPGEMWQKEEERLISSGVEASSRKLMWMGWKASGSQSDSHINALSPWVASPWLLSPGAIAGILECILIDFHPSETWNRSDGWKPKGPQFFPP